MGGITMTAIQTLIDWVQEVQSCSPESTCFIDAQEIIDHANRYAMDDEMQVIKYLGILTDIINAHPDITREEILYEINRIKEILL
jgi:hypothetical protein